MAQAVTENPAYKIEFNNEIEIEKLLTTY